MKKLLAILVVALAIPTMSFAGGEGRYQMLGLFIHSDRGIEAHRSFLVLDTKTGKVRICETFGSYDISKISCGGEKDTQKLFVQ